MVLDSLRIHRSGPSSLTVSFVKSFSHSPGTGSGKVERTSRISPSRSFARPAPAVGQEALNGRLRA